MTDHSRATLNAIPGSPPTPRTVRRARHILDNYYIGPARDPEVLEIWGYTDRFSFRPGETVKLRVSTTADTWDLAIARDGHVEDVVLTAEGLPGVHHETPEDCSVSGCGWPVAYTFTIPTQWRSGGYLVTLTGHRGEESVEEHHLFILRCGEDQEPAPILLLCATGTWVAYNCWGGSNAYEGLTGPEGDRFSPILSMERPWTRGFCKLPAGAPRTVPDAPHRPGEMARYPYMEWAYAYGYSKKYASAGWATYERHFMCWAERSGYRVDCATLHDLETHPELMDAYACVVIVGHDEYWSRNMRESLDRWIEGGGRAARFAGNFTWQIRIEDEGRKQVCYKHAYADDPVFGTDDEYLLSTLWEMPLLAWPGAATFGANAQKGVYASLGNCVGRGGGFTVYRPEHWAFQSAELGYGDILGRDSRIFGYEVDGLDYEMKHDLPFPTGEGGAALDIEILGLGLATKAEADHGIWGETPYIGANEVAPTARELYGEATEENCGRVSRGNGVMVHWHRGEGEVFNAATCEWVMGLTRADPQVEQVTRNVLDRFSR